MPKLNIKYIKVTPTVDTDAYTAGDAVGGLLTFTDAVPGGNGLAGAILDSVTIHDLSAQSVQLDLVLFSESFTATADDAAFAPSDADLDNCIGVIKIADYSDFSNNSVGTKTAINLPLRATSDTGAIYGQLVTRGTPTYAGASDVQVTLGILHG